MKKINIVIFNLALTVCFSTYVAAQTTSTANSTIITIVGDSLPTITAKTEVKNPVEVEKPFEEDVYSRLSTKHDTLYVNDPNLAKAYQELWTISPLNRKPAIVVKPTSFFTGQKFATTARKND